MQKVVFLLLLVFLSAGAFAQADTITVEKAILGYKYSHNGKLQKGFTELLAIAEDVDSARFYLKRARRNATIGSILGGAGGVLIGFQLGSSVSGGQLNARPLGIGAGLIALSIPFIVRADKSGYKGVNFYNQSKKVAKN